MTLPDSLKETLEVLVILSAINWLVLVIRDPTYEGDRVDDAVTGIFDAMGAPQWLPHIVYGTVGIVGVFLLIVKMRHTAKNFCDN